MCTLSMFRVHREGEKEEEGGKEKMNETYMRDSCIGQVSILEFEDDDVQLRRVRDRVDCV